MTQETFADVTIGDTFEHGSYEVTAEEIKEFAADYDPLPFHVDETAAEASMFGGLVASGWHTAAMTQRLIVDGYVSESGALGAAGIDELRWERPVRPGDELSVATEVIDKEPWDDDRGLVHVRVETSTDEGETVLSYVGRILYPRG